MITLGDRSKKAMVGLHPDLIKVINRAAEIAPPEQDFSILEGLRSREQMAINYGKGRTAAQCAAKGVPMKYAQPNVGKVTWLNDPYKSNHGEQPDGYGHAFDAAPYPLDWNNLARFSAMADLFKRAAADVGVKIAWGGDWKSTKDYPHIELA